MRVTLKNDFHNTETTVSVGDDGTIKADALKRARKRLCGCSDCFCGGIRGPQEVELRIDYSRNGEYAEIL